MRPNGRKPALLQDPSSYSSSQQEGCNSIQEYDKYYYYYHEQDGTEYIIHCTKKCSWITTGILIYKGCLSIIALACCLCKLMTNLWYSWLVTNGFAYLERHDILSVSVAKTGLFSNLHSPNVSNAMGINMMFWVWRASWYLVFFCSSLQ